MNQVELNAENAVIGALFIDSSCLEAVANVLSVEDFGNETTRACFKAALKLREAGRVVDPLVILSEVKGGDTLTSWAMQLMEVTPTAANVLEYCHIVKAEAKKRRLQQIIDDVGLDLITGSGWNEAAVKTVEQISRLGFESEQAINSEQAVGRWIAHYKGVRNNPDGAFCKTGYPGLDRALGGGLHNGEVYVLAGRPGMGKTTQGLGIAEKITQTGRPVLFVSLEMTEVQIVAKRVALSSGVSYTKLLNGTLSEREEREAFKAASELTWRPFYFVENATTVVDIERYAKGVEDLGAIIIDYLGLIQTGEKPAPRYEEVTRISALLKALAKRLKKPILVLAQLNRESTMRADKRPVMSDLRDSGAIEQDAGAVILLHRESYYKPLEEQPEREPIELIIAKNRHSYPCTIQMMWHGVSGQITEIVNKEMPF